MTYDNRQALTVALFNAGMRGNRGPQSFPFELADAVLANLHSMGWVLDGYLHETGVVKAREQYEDKVSSTCGEPLCDERSESWGMCRKHFDQAMGPSQEG